MRYWLLAGMLMLLALIILNWLRYMLHIHEKKLMQGFDKKLWLTTSIGCGGKREAVCIEAFVQVNLGHLMLYLVNWGCLEWAKLPRKVTWNVTAKGLWC